MIRHKKILITIIIIFLSPLFSNFSYSKQGCCSRHGGVCGDQCCDGTPLSAKCGGGSSSTPPSYRQPSSITPSYDTQPSQTKNISQDNGSSYNREDWPHWIDIDNDCQDTRAEILIRDNIGTIKYKRNKPCNVSWGKWICPYTGKVFEKASDMDIDHIVPLSHAHQTGGSTWSREKRREFANDPMNLIATEDNINQEKGDKAPDQWHPPRKEFWHEYAKRWRVIKQKYGLTISNSEERALKEMEQ